MERASSGFSVDEFTEDHHLISMDLSTSSPFSVDEFTEDHHLIGMDLSTSSPFSVDEFTEDHHLIGMDLCATELRATTPRHRESHRRSLSDSQFNCLECVPAQRDASAAVPSLSTIQKQDIEAKRQAALAKQWAKFQHDTLLLLPDNIIEMIFARLDYCTVGALHATCRHLHEPCFQQCAATQWHLTARLCRTVWRKAEVEGAVKEHRTWSEVLGEAGFRARAQVANYKSPAITAAVRAATSGAEAPIIRLLTACGVHSDLGISELLANQV